MESKSKSSGSQTYQKGEKVLCYHQNLVYEAKIIDVRDDPEKNLNYKIHYQGWNKNWDDWVSTKRLLKYNSTNLDLKLQLENDAKSVKPEQKSKSKSKKRESQVGAGGDDASSTTSAPSTPAAPTKETQHHHPRQQQQQQQQQASSVVVEPAPELVPLRPEAKIRIPDELKSWLTDDQAAIKNKNLSVIPATSTISQIFEDYLQQKRNTKLPIDRELVIGELTRGLGHYFNALLGPHLLYKFERPQYQTILEENGNDTDLTTFYGVVHLVRMFPKLSLMLSLSNLDEKSITSIVSYVHDIMRWLSKSKSYYDPDEYYQVAPPEYLK